MNVGHDQWGIHGGKVRSMLERWGHLGARPWWRDILSLRNRIWMDLRWIRWIAIIIQAFMINISKFWAYDHIWDRFERLTVPNISTYLILLLYNHVRQVISHDNRKTTGTPRSALCRLARIIVKVLSYGSWGTVWHGLSRWAFQKTCENLWKPVKTCENLWKPVKTWSSRASGPLLSRMDFTLIGNDNPNVKGINMSFIMTKAFTCLLGGL